MTVGENNSGGPPTMDLESTASLLGHIRDGSLPARDRLMRRYLDPLRRWARGRLPVGLRDLTDTDDLVQVTLLRALDHVDGFEYRKDGAFLAYLRTILQNRIRDEVRRAGRRPGQTEIPEELPAAGPSPLEQALGREALQRYERARKAFVRSSRRPWCCAWSWGSATRRSLWHWAHLRPTPPG